MIYSEFTTKYPSLYQFLSAFVIQCYEDISDNKIIEENFSPEYFSKEGKVTIQEAKEVLKLEPFPKDIIEEITNIWHENISTEDWFKEIIDKLEPRDWLQKHEIVNGGHTIEKHVGKSDEFLVDRVSNPTKYNPNQKRITGASTYLDINTAQEVISKSINQNQSNIQNWLINSRSEVLPIEYSGIDTVGKGIAAGGKNITNKTNAFTLLKKDGKGSFTVLTSYPK